MEPSSIKMEEGPGAPSPMRAEQPGPSCKRPEPDTPPGAPAPAAGGSTETSNKKARKAPAARLGAPKARFAFATDSSIILVVELPRPSAGSELEELELKFVEDRGAGVAAPRQVVTLKEDQLRDASVLVKLESEQLPRLKLTQSYTVQSLIVKDKTGAKGTAEGTASKCVHQCDGLRPSCLVATDEQLRNACDELQLRPQDRNNRRQLLKLLLERTAVSAEELLRLCKSVDVSSEGAHKRQAARKEIVSRLMEKGAGGPQATAQVVAAAALSASEKARGDAASADQKKVESQATAEASATGVASATEALASAQKAQDEAQKAFDDAQRVLKQASRQRADAEATEEGAKKKAQEDADAAVKAKNAAADQQREGEVLALVAAKAAEAAAATSAETGAGSASGPALDELVGPQKMANIIRKQWLPCASISLNELKEIQQVMLGKRTGTKTEIVAAISGVRSASELSRGLHGAAKELKDSSLIELHRQITVELKKDRKESVHFRDKETSIKWICMSLVPPRADRPKTPEPNATLPLATQVSITSTASTGSTVSTSTLLPQRQPSLKPLELLIVACTPTGVSLLPEVQDECHQIKAKMAASFKEAASPEVVQEWLNTVPTKRFLFCGHADAELNHGERTLAFTSSTGGLAVIEPQRLSQMLGGIAERGTLELVFLNGCCSAALGKAVIDAGVRNVVCWESPTLDSAARVFSVAFFEAVQQMINQGNAVNYKAAFASAKSKVEHITRPGKLSNGKPADVPKYELRAPKLELRQKMDANGQPVMDAYGQPVMKPVDTSFSDKDYTPKPLAAGIPLLLPEASPLAAPAAAPAGAASSSSIVEMDD